YARLRSLVCALVLIALAAIVASGRAASSLDGAAEAGATIFNRAEATYTDADGEGFSVVSPTVSVTVLTVAAVTVTPDETDPSATVAPGERVARLFRVCNTGNTPDFYTITSVDVTAPAALVSLHFDTDASGTLTDSDREITLGATMSPRLARGQCVGVIATLDTNAGAQGQQFSVRINALSTVTDALNADEGSVVSRRIEIHLAQLAVGEAVEVSFQARISAGVAHGTGVINVAALKADNAPAISCTSATAVVNPFGVVYEGRSAGTPVAGARVSLLAEDRKSVVEGQ